MGIMTPAGTKLSTCQRKLIEGIVSSNSCKEGMRKTTRTQKLLTYSWFWKLSMGNTLDYLAWHMVVMSYKELMVDRLDRWTNERTSGSE